MSPRKRIWIATAVAIAIVACLPLLWLSQYQGKSVAKPFKGVNPDEVATSLDPAPEPPSKPLAGRDDQHKMPVGWPSPAPDVLRGENQSRKFGVPVSHSLPAKLSERAPEMLTMLPGDGRTTLLPEEIDLHTKTSRRLVLDPAPLERIIKGEASRLLVPTPENDWLEIEFRSVKARSGTTHTLTGGVVGTGQSTDAQFVYHEGVLHGTVANYSTSQEFEYRVLADGYLMVRELDQTSMTADCASPGEHADETSDEGGEPSHEESKEQTSGSSSTTGTESAVSSDTIGSRQVDIVVGYDQGARAADGGVSQIEARIIASVDRMNTAFSNSLVTGVEIMLLGTIEDPNYVFPGAVVGKMGSEDEVGNLNNPTDGVLDTVSNYATLLGADLQSFVLQQVDGSAGVAYRPGLSSVTARTYMTATRITFGHEVGHNLGCNHSWGDSSSDIDINHERYGWRLDADRDPATTGDRVRTIMSYDWGWGTGVRIPYFSNPAVTYMGARTGQAKGYNVAGDSQSDQRYAVGGLGFKEPYISDPNARGFDGSNPGLGANNASLLLNGDSWRAAHGTLFASNRATRSALSVTAPVAASLWERGSSVPVTFTGGDYEYSVTVQIFKGTSLVSTIAANVSNAATQRSFSWQIPTGQASGSDYFARVMLTHPVNGTNSADSASFTVKPSIAATPTGLVATAGNAKVNLVWDPAFEASSYNVKRATTSGGPYVLIGTSSGTSFLDSNAFNGTQYHYVVSATNVAGESPNSAEAIAIPQRPPGSIGSFPSGESTILGTVSGGSIADTWLSDQKYQVLTETQSGGAPKNRTSQLEHTWTFEVEAGELMTFYVEAYRSVNSEGDNFKFSYSTDGIDFTDMVTVSKTTDDNVPLSFALPSSVSGTVQVRVVDTDRTSGRSNLDSLFIDEIVIVSDVAQELPLAATAPSPANGATGVSVNRNLEWTGDALASSHNIYFGSSSLTFQGNQTEVSFNPGVLSPLTTYYWRVDEVNSVGTTIGTVWSFTTAAAAPEMYVSSIALDASKSGKNYQGVAIVRIVDASTGTPVSGATVTGSFTGSFAETASAVTDSSGNARVLTSSKKPLPLNFTFTVTAVSDGTRDYRPTLNVVTSASGGF